jgi:hypothetical protein
VRRGRVPFALLVFPATFAIASLVALAVFTNRERLLECLVIVAATWLPLLGLLALLAGWGPLRAPVERHAAACSVGTFALAAALGSLVESREGRLVRHLVQIGLVWLPVLAAAFLPAILRRWRDALLLLAASVACLGPLWLFGPVLMRHVIVPAYNLDVDHRPRPNTGGTNGDGLYTRYRPADLGSEGINIVCLGDSFTANPHLPEAQRYPAVLERLLRARCGERAVRVVNFGWVSSSPVLQVRQLRDLGARYRPHVVVQGFDMTDFHDDLRAEARLRRLADDDGRDVSLFRAFIVGASLALGVDDYGAWLRERLSWEARPQPAEELQIPRERFFALFRPLEQTEPLLRASWNAVLETERVARGLGARYALVVFPRYPQYNRSESPRDRERRVFPTSDDYILEPFRYFSERARSVSFPVHSALEDFATAGVFPTCLPDDPHWNAAGNRVAAEAVARHLVADGFVGECSG